MSPLLRALTLTSLACCGCVGTFTGPSPHERSPDASARDAARDALDSGSLAMIPDAGAPAIELDAALAPMAHDASHGDDARPDEAADASGPMKDAAAPGPCSPLVLAAHEPFTPTEAEPFRRTDLDIDDGLVFGRIEVELSFVRGPWAAAHPDGRLGMHNLFWVHRGTRGQDWLDNSVGYLNFTAASQLRLETNLGITDESVWSDVLSGSGCATEEGGRYHIHYVYDAEHHRWWFELTTESGEMVCGREDVPLLDRIDGTSTGRRPASNFFIEIGHAVWTPDHDGPEVATLGWTYSDAEVRLHPLGCP